MQPLLAQIQPLLAEIQPLLAQIQPLLAQIQPLLAQMQPLLHRIHTTVLQMVLFTFLVTGGPPCGSRAQLRLQGHRARQRVTSVFGMQSGVAWCRQLAPLQLREE